MRVGDALELAEQLGAVLLMRELMACAGGLLLVMSAVGLLADGLTIAVAMGAGAGALLLVPMMRR